ncbi:MAG: M3 family oligoendopeptidase [Bacteroidota bacterium]
MSVSLIEQHPRQYLPGGFQVDSWEGLAPYFNELEARDINSVKELEKWLKDASELEAVISEEACWRQIRMTCDTEDPKLAESFEFFMSRIQPTIQPVADRLNKKLISCSFTQELDTQKYFTYLRNVRKNIDLFRESNITIQSELNIAQQEYGAIVGKMTIDVNGQEYTLAQAAKFLEDPDRSVRESVYHKISVRRLEDRDRLESLFEGLLEKRSQLANNACFADYRAYRFAELGRFDYTQNDCELFHQAVREQVMPLVNELLETKRKQLGVDRLRPWDLDAEPIGTKPLRPFNNGRELIDRTVDCLNQLDPLFGNCLLTMNDMGRLDVESRKGKAPGGYNCPLAETGAPFIFMNAAGTMDDVTTMVHESGHAVHSFLSHPLELNGFKEYPTEIAEVASMSMELFTMDHWSVFFPDPSELKRAKQQQLERVIILFPWIATIDAFQHWLYLHPGHSRADREAAWLRILDTYTSPVLDVSGTESYRSALWQRQLHLFEVPFYYIEYGIAQLGAIGMWKQYQQNPSMALKKYRSALQAGGTCTLPALFELAGLPFDLSPNYIGDLMRFVKSELEKLDH